MSETFHGDLAGIWKNYPEKVPKTAELRMAHKSFHKLSKPLAESEFNCSQHIVIVSAGPDDKAQRIAGWLKTADVPIYYASFNVYRSADRPKEFLIDVSPVALPIGMQGPGLGNDYWLNSCERHLPGSFRKMLRLGLACTYGPVEYGRKLEPLEVGSRIFLYVSGIGVVAEGTVTERWSGKPNEKALTAKAEREYSVGVNWVQHTTDPEQAVTAREVVAIGQKLFIPTFMCIDGQVAKNLSDKLKEKTAK